MSRDFIFNCIYRYVACTLYSLSQTLPALGHWGQVGTESMTQTLEAGDKYCSKLLWALLHNPFILSTHAPIDPKKVSIQNSSSWLADIICIRNYCSLSQSSIRSSCRNAGVTDSPQLGPPARDTSAAAWSPVFTYRQPYHSCYISTFCF